jgi:hypothetical protein
MRVGRGGSSCFGVVYPGDAQPKPVAHRQGQGGRKEREEEREREREKQRVVVVVVVVGVPENGWVGRKKESGVKQQKRKRNIEGGIYRQQPRTFARRHKKKRR